MGCSAWFIVLGSGLQQVTTGPRSPFSFFLRDDDDDYYYYNSPKRTLEIVPVVLKWSSLTLYGAGTSLRRTLSVSSICSKVLIRFRMRGSFQQWESVEVNWLSNCRDWSSISVFILAVSAERNLTLLHSWLNEKLFFAGFIADQAGSYVIAFYTAGSLGILFAFLPFILLCAKQETNREEVDSWT